MSTNRNFSIVVTAMVLAAAFSGQAETRFNGTVDTDWHNAANWSAGVPTSTLQARLQSQKTADINSPAVAGGLNFRGGVALGTSIINVNNGGSLTSDGSDFDGVNRIGAGGGDATLNINNGGSVGFSGTGLFEVGENVGLAGYVNVYTGGTLQVSQETILGADAGCTGVLTIDGGAVTISKDFKVGNPGGAIGRVVLRDGTLTVSGGKMMLGYNAGTAVGYVDMTGGTITHNSGDILVGRKGVATFTQSGGTIDASSMVAGNMAGGDGTINISGGSNVVSGTITLGRVIGSKGTLLMSGGSMTAAALKVGSGDGANGSEGVFTLSGKDTYLKADTLSLGDAGMDVASTLRIEDGEFQIQSIVADGNSANESFFLEGGVLKLRHVSSPNIVNDIDALITAGVFTWTNASPDSLAATHSPSTATRTWTNAAGVKLYADESGTNYSYIWAATPPEKSLKLFMISSSN